MGMSKILVVGASNIDVNYYLPSLPKPGESAHTISSSLVSLGGKGLNQAVAVKRAGGDITFLSVIGNDTEGKMIEDSLSKEGISLQLGKASCPTGKALILNEKDGENAVIVDSGANALLDVAFLEERRALFEECSCILLQNEMPLSSVEWILKQYGKSKRIFYNPSPLQELQNDFYGYIDTLLINEMEAMALGKASNPKASVSSLLSFGVKNVLLTKGEKGSSLFNGNTEIKVPSIKTEVVDTIGAGDTYAGYYIASISNGHNEKEAMVIATSAASLSIRKKGAFASIPYLSEVLKIV